jgi:hypothetical protein
MSDSTFTSGAEKGTNGSTMGMSDDDSSFTGSDRAKAERRPESLGSRPWWRLPLCALSLCGFRTASDDTGCWGECVTCGKRAGFVDRATLGRYADAEYAKEMRRRGQAPPLQVSTPALDKAQAVKSVNTDMDEQQ